MEAQRKHSGPSGARLASPGPMLKALRLERGWSLAQVSERTGIPTSTLSKIENGKTELTMDRLLRISVALEVNIADIIGSPQEEYASGDRGRRSITRVGEAQAIRSEYGEYCYHAGDLLEKRVSPLTATIEAKSLEDFGEFHRHQGEEFLYVLEGELALYTDTYAPVHLHVGDSIYFDSEMGHAYVSVGEAACKILLVCVPRHRDVVRTSDGPIDSPSIGAVQPLRPLQALRPPA